MAPSLTQENGAPAPAAPAQPQPQLLKGILMITGTVLCFSCMDAIAKWLGMRGVPPMQVVAIRYIGSVVFVSLLLNPVRAPAMLRTRNLRLQVIRSACLVLSTTCTYIAVRHMTLTGMTALIFAAPLIVPLLSGPLLGEKVGPRRITAVFVGFLGVLLVTRPGGDTFTWWAVLPLIGAGLNAFYSIATRKLAAYDQPETTMFYTGMVGSAVLLPVLFFVWEPLPDVLEWVLLGGIGALGAVAHWLLILAHKHAPASLLAPYNYAQIVGATLIGYFVFNNIPDHWTFMGGAIIIASGLYIFYREQVIKRKARENAVWEKWKQEH